MAFYRVIWLINSVIVSGISTGSATVATKVCRTSPANVDNDCIARLARCISLTIPELLMHVFELKQTLTAQLSVVLSVVELLVSERPQETNACLSVSELPSFNLRFLFHSETSHVLSFVSVLWDCTDGSQALNVW